jgi:branched-chain amino acid transport system ATP-binding protein
MGILETKDLYHDFDGMQVLSEVNLKIHPGERHAIIGPNGAGKTTLFNVITGRYHASQGMVLFKGKNVTRFKPYQLSRMGLGRSFQITSTFQKQTAFQNIRLSVLSKQKIRYNLLRRADTMQHITEETENILKDINLYEERHTLASSLSYGKQRSLELGMAIGINPDLLMFDEPTAGMSKDETHSAVQLIRKLTEGKSMVIVEHDMDVVFSLADRITVLHHGQILATGRPEEIKKDERVKSAYLGDTEV